MDKHILEQIPLYLDDELQEGERLAVETHTKICGSCRAALDAERALIAAVREAHPRHRAPESLQENVVKLLRSSGAGSGSRLRWLPVAACILLLVGLAVVWFTGGRPLDGRRNPLVATAVDNHLRYLDGQLPLEILSDAPDRISAWFAGKLRFNLKLPDYPQRAGETKPYQIEGARLVGFGGDYAAYIVYRLNGHPISLLVTSDLAAEPSGGEEIPWEGLRFHFQSVAGWKVLTWSDNGLTYALVSDLEERGQASCIVCHQDERVFRGLRSQSEGM